MQVNPVKFQVTAVGKISNEHLKEFQIDNLIIQCEDGVTLLGYTFS
jgi:hypothetical protein